MQKNKYLDDLGIDEKNYGTNFIKDNDKRAKIWKNQRKIYGFDSRECWNLNITFVEWLYSHLMMYLEDCEEIIDLENNSRQFFIEEKKLNLKESILFIIKSCENYKKKSLDYEIRSIEEETKMEEEIYNNIKLAMKLWGEILPYMWW